MSGSSIVGRGRMRGLEDGAGGGKDGELGACIEGAEEEDIRCRLKLRKLELSFGGGLEGFVIVVARVETLFRRPGKDSRGEVANVMKLLLRELLLVELLEELPVSLWVLILRSLLNADMLLIGGLAARVCGVLQI